MVRCFEECIIRKNDIINVVSQEDEHCWVGELNGLIGWFPAKFVQVKMDRTGTGQGQDRDRTGTGQRQDRDRTNKQDKTKLVRKRQNEGFVYKSRDINNIR